MVPTITAQGTSFQGAFLYYFHDKGERSRNRIGFTETMNMLTESVDKAWKVMAYTAKYAAYLKQAAGYKATGAKLKKAVFAYSLSWHPEQSPSKEEMLQAAKDSLEVLGLSEHEAMIAEHTDEPHPHLHVVVNKVHPLTGLVAKLKYTKEKLSDFAFKHERKEGKVYCSNREENRAKRENGQKTKFVDPAIANAWTNSRDVESFKNNLETKGYQLAQGDKCIVIVDSKGKPQNAARALGQKKREFEERLGSNEISKLRSFAEAKQALRVKAPELQKSPITEERTTEWLEHKANAVSALALKQFDETSAVSSKLERDIGKKRGELVQFYQAITIREKITKLEAKLGKSGFIQRFIGLHARRERRLDDLHKGLADAQKRIEETIQPMAEKKASALEELRAVHVEQRQALENSFDQWNPELAAKQSEPNLSISRPVLSRDNALDFER